MTEMTKSHDPSTWRPSLTYRLSIRDMDKTEKMTTVSLLLTAQF